MKYRRTFYLDLYFLTACFIILWDHYFIYETKEVLQKKKDFWHSIIEWAVPTKKQNNAASLLET
jgi:hypothetical protein